MKQIKVHHVSRAVMRWLYSLLGPDIWFQRTWIVDPLRATVHVLLRTQTVAYVTFTFSYNSAVSLSLSLFLSCSLSLSELACDWDQPCLMTTGMWFVVLSSDSTRNPSFTFTDSLLKPDSEVGLLMSLWFCVTDYSLSESCGVQCKEKFYD